MVIETKTKGMMMHLRAWMKRSPISPIHIITTSLVDGSSGFQYVKPMPSAIPITAPPSTKAMGIFSWSSQSLVPQLFLTSPPDSSMTSSCSWPTVCWTMEGLVRKECLVVLEEEEMELAKQMLLLRSTTLLSLAALLL